LPTIGLTTFVDFISSTGLPRVRAVESARRADNQEYDPRKDFYRRLRDATKSYLYGHTDVHAYLQTPLSLADRKKQTNFPLAIESIIDWRARNPGVSRSPVRGVYRVGDLSVNVNPELCLETSSGLLAAKFWFKTEPVPRARLNYILATMRYGLDSFSGDVGILDVRRQVLHQAGAVDPQLRVLLRGEATAFMSMWEALGES
jgi:hypothetical protein